MVSSRTYADAPSDSLNALLLDGSIPIDIGHMAELHHLEIQNNLLTGTFPTQFGGLINLESLLASGNDFSDVVLDSICGLEELQTFKTDCLSEVICPCCTQCF